MWLSLTQKIGRFFSRLRPKPDADRILNAFAKHLSSDSSLILDEASLPYDKATILTAFESEASTLRATIREMSGAGISESMIQTYMDQLISLETSLIHLLEYQAVDPIDVPHISSIELAGGLDGINDSLKRPDLLDHERAILEGLRQTGLALTVKYMDKTNREQEAYFNSAT